MFQVEGRVTYPRTKYYEHTYMVYTIDQTNPVKTLFLIWYVGKQGASSGKWVWESAELFVPKEG